MKFAYALVTTGLLIAAGCIPESFLNKDDADVKPAPEVSRLPAKPRTYITPEQVDEGNFREKEKVLRQELEMDERDAAKTTAVPVKK